MRPDALSSSISRLPLGRLMSTAEAADYLGLQEQTLRAWRAERRGPNFVKLGDGRFAPVRYRLQDLDSWASGNVVPLPKRRGRPRKSAGSSK